MTIGSFQKETVMQEMFLCYHFHIYHFSPKKIGETLHHHNDCYPKEYRTKNPKDPISCSGERLQQPNLMKLTTCIGWQSSFLPRCCNSSPPGQNGWHFAHDIFRCIYLNEKFCILIRISLKFVPKGSIDNNPGLVKIMAWRLIGNKPLSEPMLTWSIDAYLRH